MNLDENYSAATKLSAWWKQVKNNFSAIKTEFSSVTAKLDQKVNKTDYASTTKAGVIKLAASGGGTNNSGLVVFEDGSAAVNVRPDRGIKRDGAGQIGTNPATQAEVNDGTDEYKPITPKTLKAVMDTLPEFEATGFEEFGKEYKGGSMRYLYNTLSYEPETDHLYIYNDKLADSSLQPDGTVGTEVGWVELAFKHDVTAVAEDVAAVAEDVAPLKNLSSYSEVPMKVGTWVNGVPIYRIAFPWISIQQTDTKYGSRTLILDPDSGTIKISLGNLLSSKSILTSPSGKNYLYPVNISIFHWSEDFDWMFTPVKVDNTDIVLIENDSKRYQDYMGYGNGYWGGYVDISIPDAAFTKTESNIQ